MREGIEVFNIASNSASGKASGSGGGSLNTRLVIFLVIFAVGIYLFRNSGDGAMSWLDDLLKGGVGAPDFLNSGADMTMPFVFAAIGIGALLKATGDARWLIFIGSMALAYNGIGGLDSFTSYDPATGTGGKHWFEGGGGDNGNLMVGLVILIGIPLYLAIRSRGK